jgi:L-ascorbate metabolism protein UlaG (beta-lactamase superfamily)
MNSPREDPTGRGCRITLVRNATIILEIDGRRLLVDPMFDDVGARPPVENTANSRRNPLVPLPSPPEELVRGLSAVLVTHLHRDHFDDGAAHHLPRMCRCFASLGMMRTCGRLACRRACSSAASFTMD